MRAIIAAVLAALCVAGASMARGDDGAATSPTPTSEMIVAAVAAAEQAANLPEDGDRCSLGLLEGQPS